MQWRVPLADVNFGPEEEAAVAAVIRSGWLTMGSVTQAFEQEFAAFVGSKHALAVTNATAALHLACLALGVGPGDEVIVPSLTFVASVNAIRYTGAVPLFADIESLDWLDISPNSIEEAITDRTKAIMVVHYAGYACDMPAILEIAHQHHLAVIEDAAHAVGASLNERALGTWGQIGCYSFFGNKNLTTGEGGMLVTNDDKLAEKSRILRSHGMTTLTWDRHQGHASTYDVVDLGYNYRIDEMRSAMGRVQLGRIPSGNARRTEIVTLYRELLADLAPQIKIPFSEARGLSSYHIMPVLLPEGADRQAFMAGMKDAGIQTSWHYPPAHTFSIYAKEWQARGKTLPVTEAVAAREVTLPLYPTMTEEQVRWVVEAITDFFRIPQNTDAT
ncbi:MAG: DegT/DnrJ/EryC1/StrS family aminotransferase [Anaerolineaceae bacterium]